MFITPFMAAVLIGTFWTGVGTAAVVNHGDLFAPKADVTITAQASDHITACHARYRSYDEGRDMWLSSRDGRWHTCAL
jgi:hypothetical protein